MKSFPRSKSAGFTLIELMIGVVILGVITAMGLPSFKQMIRNSQVRVAAESVANGIQRARAEAVAHNAKVQFVIGAGTSWTVDYVTKPVPADPALDSRPTSESPNVALTAVAADLATPVTTITFNQLGQVVANADATPAISRVTFLAVGSNVGLVAGVVLGLRVTVGAGGNARVCDPSLPASNVRAC